MARNRNAESIGSVKRFDLSEEEFDGFRNDFARIGAALLREMVARNIPICELTAKFTIEQRPSRLGDGTKVPIVNIRYAVSGQLKVSYSEKDEVPLINRYIDVSPAGDVELIKVDDGTIDLFGSSENEA